MVCMMDGGYCIWCMVSRGRWWHLDDCAHWHGPAQWRCGEPEAELARMGTGPGRGFQPWAWELAWAHLSPLVPFGCRSRIHQNSSQGIREACPATRTWDRSSCPQDPAVGCMHVASTQMEKPQPPDSDRRGTQLTESSLSWRRPQSRNPSGGSSTIFSQP